MNKVLIISNSAGLITDFLNNDIMILKSMGYEVECACNMNFLGKDSLTFFKKYNIKTYHVDFPIRDLNIKKVLKSYIQIRKIMSNNGYKIVHCHSTIAATIGRQCGKKYRKKGTKIFYTSHGFPFYDGNRSKKSKLFYSIEKYYSKYTDVIITICNEDYENALKMNCKNVYKINGIGIDFNKINSTNFDKKKYRKEFGCKNGEIVLLSIGELNTNKNHSVVIKALSELKCLNILYIICGREVTEIGKKQELIRLAKKLNVRVKFLGFRKDIPEIVNSSDLGVISSYKEGLGLSGVEMLAAGIPVVGSNRQGIKDYVVDGKTGYLCNPESSSSFAKGIENCIKLINKKETKTICKDISKKYSKENSYNKMLEIYKNNIS